MVRRLRSVEEITAVANGIEGATRRSLVAGLVGGPRVELVVAGLHEAIPGDATDGHPPIRRELVIDARAFDVPGAMADGRGRAALGYDVKVVHDLPFNFLIIDGESAIIDTTNTDPNGQGSLFIREPTMIRALEELAGRLMGSGTSLPGDLSHSHGPFDARDHHILSLLAAGMSDAAIARQAQISQRTVERRIRAILTALGVATRFQAGVQAARQGLI